MDYADETYVRVYVRDTKTWLRLKFEGQTLLMHLMRKLDRAGVLDGLDDPENDIVLITGAPIKLVRVGLARLLKEKVFELQDGLLVMPNYIEAQSVARTDKARQRDARKRRLAKARLVTKRDEMSRAVTGGHEPSQPVTLHSAVLSSAALSCADPDPERARDEVVEPPQNPDGADTRWKSYPPGWHWSPETEAAAAAAVEKVTPAELREHVNFWTTHDFARPVNDLDGELRRSFKMIRERVNKLGGGAAGGALHAYSWVPNAEHRTYAADKQRDLDEVVPIYRREANPDLMSTLHADKDFMNRLRCWVATGEFIPKGELPLRLRKALPRAAESDRSAVAS